MHWGEQGAVVDHVTYCTANVAGSQAKRDRQSDYIRALKRSGSVDRVERGLFRETYKEYPRAIRGADGRPILQGGGGLKMVGVAHREEKGSDVNLASRLLIDALKGRMQAAVIVSNDSDLKLPVQEARKLMPVGAVSPHPGVVHKSLRPAKGELGHGHWLHSLTLAELLACQLPDPCEGIRRPRRW